MCLWESLRYSTYVLLETGGTLGGFFSQFLLEEKVWFFACCRIAGVFIGTAKASTLTLEVFHLQHRGACGRQKESMKETTPALFLPTNKVM